MADTLPSVTDTLLDAGPAEPGMFGFSAPQTPAAAPAYRVLARKYRPQIFDDLIGQEAMVRTLANAFAVGRVHQAYIFTGVRGVGKTTTARILARAFNYEREDGTGGPTIDLAVPGRHCQAIIDGRHVDVIEMDAASHTGIDDIREIIESVRYQPAYARNKVYIIDEVHMLSKAAFNGLLKTLEEPPPHVKFLFATTEIRKVPITVLSRCQRFDLRRIDAGMLAEHLAKICRLEGVDAEPEALGIISRSAEGSVRDALSLLDQAIAHGAGKVDGETVRAMLGLADRGRVIDLFEHLMRGDVQSALAELGAQYKDGADPSVIVSDLAEYVHIVTRLKLVAEAAKDPSMTEVERVRGLGFAKDLPLRILTRAWQILLKGLAEVQAAPRPLAAAEMLLVRLAFAADLPTPDEAIRLLRDGGSIPAAPANALPPPPPSGGSRMLASGGGPSIQSFAPSPARPQFETHTNLAPASARMVAASEPKLVLRRLEDFVALAEERREIDLKIVLERHVRPVRFEMGTFEFAAMPTAAPDLANKIKKALDEWTGIRWAVAISQEEGGETLFERSQARQAEAERGIRSNPFVRSVLEKFPGAQIVNIQQKAAAAEAGEDETPYLDEPSESGYTDDDL
ncbi:MAG: DNA polymerase III subunit gamma/tau [Beijerinckiaceae bacterium]|nr:DNA polymerase III subunit gamma/tau [Beijerinckiaceae bacterium]